MTIAENIWLTHEPLRPGLLVNGKAVTGAHPGAARPLCRHDPGGASTPTRPVASLPPDEKQIVEILKALSQEPRLIILDEATASLDSQQVSRLFDLVHAVESGRAGRSSSSRIAWTRSFASPTASSCCATARPWANWPRPMPASATWWR